MTPCSSVAMLEKFALLRIAFCRAPVLRSAFLRRTSMTAVAFSSRVAARLTRFAGGARNCRVATIDISSFVLGECADMKGGGFLWNLIYAMNAPLLECGSEAARA